MNKVISRAKIRKIADNNLPTGSLRRKVASKTYQLVKSTVARPISIPSRQENYEQWMESCEPALWVKAKRYKLEPLISIVVPAFNTPDKYLHQLIDSVVNQKYTKWQLCIADGSTDSARAEMIKQACSTHQGIIYKRLDDNFGIVGNTNEALKLVQGEFIGFLDHDDTLSEHALLEVVDALNNKPDTDLFYSDEDKLSDDGKHRKQPFFKPGWSPETLLGVNYITHFVVARKDLIQKIGGLRQGFDAAQDYDFILRFSEISSNIVHIPKVLYHWRLADGSTAKTIGEKNHADPAGKRALKAALKRRNISAEVINNGDNLTNYRIRFKLASKQPKVSIIIPFKDKPKLLKQCVSSILTKTTYKNYELILISNNSTNPKTHQYLDELKVNPKCKIFAWDNPFNYSKINNFGRSKANGEFLVLLNNDTEVISKEWLEELIGVAAQPEIGAVGPLLYYRNNTIQHAGVILGMMGMAGHVFRKLTLNQWTEFGLPSWPRNYLAVTAACLAIKVSKFDEVGGLDEKFTLTGNDVAFCLSLYEKGYRNVYWPFVQLVHYESVSVGSYNNGIQTDYDHSLDYYRPYLNWNDPYFNPNLDLMNEQIGLRNNI